MNTEIEEMILEKLNQLSQVLIPSKEVLTLDEVAQYTGLSKSCIYKHTANMTIPHYKPFNKCIFFSKIDVDSWLQQNRVEAVAGPTESITRNHKGGVKC
jgi:excisionase family DNA binding protein